MHKNIYLLNNYYKPFNQTYKTMKMKQFNYQIKLYTMKFRKHNNA